MPAVGPAPGLVLDGTYLLHEAVGGGAFGAVYRATHLALQKGVAVKLLHAGAELTAQDFHRFRVEAEALGRLAHPNIVTVTDFGVDPAGGGVPYLVMEFVAGQTLESVAGGEGPVDLAVAIAWLRQVAAALDHAHAHGVTHGDLTAKNVLVTGTGPEAAVTVIDFGLALLGGDDHGNDEAGASALARRVVVTPEYASPERLRGAAASPASDVYALAVLAYRLLTGHHPFDGDRRVLMQARLTGEAPAASTRHAAVPAAVDAVLARGLASAPGDRPSRAGDLVAQLAEVAGALAQARWRRQEAPRRFGLALTLALGAILVGPMLASLDVVQRIEGATEDARVALSPAHAPDPRLLLVSIDDETLAADARPLTDRATPFATAVSRVFAAGAAGVAVDLLLPETWAASTEFGDLVLHRADQLVLGLASDGTDVVGPEAVDGLVAGALGPVRASRLFGLVTNTPAPDGVIRRGRLAVTGAAGRTRATLAGRTGQIAGVLPAGDVPDSPFVVDYRADPDEIERLGWQAFETALDAGRRFDGRIVIVGAEFTGSGDRHRAPRPGHLATDITGLALQGLMANTVLQGQRLREVDAVWTRLATGGLVFGLAAALLWLPHPAAGLVGVSLLVTATLLAGLAFRGGLVVDVAASLLLMAAAGGIALARRTGLPDRPE